MTETTYLSAVPTSESCSTTVTGVADLRVALHELADGSVMLDLEMIDGQGSGLALGAVFFDFGAPELLGMMSAWGDELRDQRFAKGAVTSLRGGAAAARGYDCGVALRKPNLGLNVAGFGASVQRRAKAVLSHERLSICLADLAGRDFAVQLVPVAANHQGGETLVVTGRFPSAPPAAKAQPRDAVAKDGSIFGGLFDNFPPIERSADMRMRSIA